MNIVRFTQIIFFYHFWTLGKSNAEKKYINLPLVINTWAFTEANAAAWNVLKVNSNSGLDALVEGCSTCERLQCDGTVGYGGSPDENGETTLDALVIDGRTIEIGAVAGVREIKDVIRLARYVLEHTQHTMLVGEAATKFAEMLGFQRANLSTPQSIAMWEKWRSEKCQPNFWKKVYPDPQENCGPYKPLTSAYEKCNRLQYSFSKYNHDTIGMIVINANGEIYAGTSTNGAKHKIPGRVGDSPIPGAGAYADNTVGACVATGDGDIMMRFLPSFLAVERLRMGESVLQAAQYAMNRIIQFHPNFMGALLVVDKFGNYSAACVGMKKFPFSVAGGNSGQDTRVEYKSCIETE